MHNALCIKRECEVHHLHVLLIVWSSRIVVSFRDAQILIASTVHMQILLV